MLMPQARQKVKRMCSLCRTLVVVLGRQSGDQLNDAFANLGILDAREGPDQLKPFRGRHDLRDVGRSLLLGESGTALEAVDPVEEKVDVDPEDLGDVHEARDADAVGALLV